MLAGLRAPFLPGHHAQSGRAHKRRLRAGHRSRSCSPGTGPASRSRPGGGTPRRARPASRAGRGGVRCARRRPGPARPRIWRDRLRPGPGRAGPEVLLDERNHRADVLKADPEALAPPDPHRPPGPGRIDHLDHHTTATSRDDAAAGQPLTGSQGSTSSTRPVGACVTATRWRLGTSRRTSHRSQRSSASGHTQLWLGIVEVLEISGGRSPLIIGDLDVYTQLPDPTGAPTFNSEEPLCLVRLKRTAS